MKSVLQKRGHWQNESERKSLWQFIQMLQKTKDSPTLIQRIAENRRYFVYCAAILNPDGHFPLPFTPYSILQVLKSHAIDHARLIQRLEPVARALGITSAGTIQTDYYEILGISSDAGYEQIKSAYRERARETHPDTMNGDERQFIAVSEAYKVLSDKTLRRQYDISLKKAENWTWSETPAPEPVYRKKIFSSRRTLLALLLIVLFMLSAIFISDFMVHELSLSSDDPATAFKHQPPSLRKSSVNIPRPVPKADVRTDNEDVTTGFSRQKNPLLKSRTAHPAKQPDKKHDLPQMSDTKGNIDSFNLFEKEIPTLTPKRLGSKVSENSQKKERGQEIEKSQKIPTHTVKDISAPDQGVESLSSRKTASVAPIDNIAHKPSSTPYDFNNIQIQKDTAEEQKKQKQQSEAVIQETNKPILLSDLLETISPEAMAARIQAFIDFYVKNYEEKNMEEFLSLFSANATENGRPISEKIPLYRHHFQSLAELHYEIKVNSYAWDLASNRIVTKGRFSLTWRKKNASGYQRSHGLIKMTLIPWETETFRVESLSYAFIK